jgi:hypothetical protein
MKTLLACGLGVLALTAAAGSAAAWSMPASMTCGCPVAQHHAVHHTASRRTLAYRRAPESTAYAARSAYAPTIDSSAYYGGGYSGGGYYGPAFYGSAYFGPAYYGAAFHGPIFRGRVLRAHPVFARSFSSRAVFGGRSGGGGRGGGERFAAAREGRRGG